MSHGFFVAQCNCLLSSLLPPFLETEYINCCDSFQNKLPVFLSSIFFLTNSTMADMNIQSITDFWLFVVYCLVVIVVFIFFWFYFNRVLGQVLTFVVNQYTWRQYNAYIEVGNVFLVNKNISLAMTTEVFSLSFFFL